MQLAHAAYNHLLRLLVHAYTKGRILTLKLGKRLLKSDSALVFSRFDSETHDGVWHKHALTFSVEGVISLSKGVTSCALYSEYSKDISSSYLLSLFHVVSMQFDHS